MLNLIAVLSYVVVGWVSSYFAHVLSIVYSTPDSRSYHVVGQWLLGLRSLPPESLMRPFFYPLLQELAARVGGTVGVWLFIGALGFFALNDTAAATYRFGCEIELDCRLRFPCAGNQRLIDPAYISRIDGDHRGGLAGNLDLRSLTPHQPADCGSSSVGCLAGVAAYCREAGVRNPSGRDVCGHARRCHQKH